MVPPPCQHVAFLHTAFLVKVLSISSLPQITFRQRKRTNNLAELLRRLARNGVKYERLEVQKGCRCPLALITPTH